MRPSLPALAFLATSFAFVNDFVGTKGLQPATPDTCAPASVSSRNRSRAAAARWCGSTALRSLESDSDMNLSLISQ